MGPFSLERHDLDNEPITAAATRVTPIMREHVLRCPLGGIIWRRPVALSVTAQGRTYRVPIININLRATIAAVAIGFLFAILIRVLSTLGRSH